MKPTKNRYYCPTAHKEKICFSSSKEAHRFLYYNAEAATDDFGKKPCRVYYCYACASYHVTSQMVGRSIKSFIKVFGEEIGTEIYDTFNTLTEGKRQIEPILRKNIKELKRLMRFDKIEWDRCENIIAETIDLFSLSFQYRIGNKMNVHNLFKRFSSLCYRYKAYHSIA